MLDVQLQGQRVKEVGLVVRHVYCIYCLDIEEKKCKKRKHTPEVIILRKVCLWRLSRRGNRLLTGKGLDVHLGTIFVVYLTTLSVFHTCNRGSMGLEKTT